MMLSTIWGPHSISNASCTNSNRRNPYKEAVLVRRKALTQAVQQLELVLRVECTPVEDVFARRVAINTETLGNLADALRTEGALGVNVRNLALSTAHILGKLADD